MKTSLTPRAKVIAGGLGGAVSTFLIWVLQTYGNVALPVEVAGAIVTIIGAVVAYLTPEANSVELHPDFEMAKERFEKNRERVSKRLERKEEA